ncbi:MAG TPA: FG-GAP-like repeat-containing protein [Phnomibacter sp.]|nr:FG-GAP-like repeat-containing protein [Phnomibacter sp.]
MKGTILRGVSKRINIQCNGFLKFFSFKYILWIVNLFGANAALYAQPIIQSFSPLTGPVGTSITIQGSGFSAIPSQNRVMIGGIVTPVIAASSNSLTVQAPTGADWRNITVSIDGLIGYSKQPFIVTYPADYSSLDRSQFDPDLDLPVKGVTGCETTGDLDGDGKPELVMGLPNRGGLLINRNTSVPGAIQLSDTLFYTTYPGISNVICADLNGDGWLDLAGSHESQRRIMILINKGNGNIDFEPAIAISTSDKPRFLAAGDLNQDGRV